MNIIELDANNMNDVIHAATKLEETDDLQIIKYKAPEPIPVTLGGEPLFYLNSPYTCRHLKPAKLSLWEKTKQWFSKVWFEFKYGFEKQHSTLHDVEPKRYLPPPDRTPGKRTKQTRTATRAKSTELKLGPRPNQFHDVKTEEQTNE